MDNEIRFLIQCYFGDIDDPYLTSIDKAYFDMQTHTVNGNKDDIYRMRYLETEYLYKRITKLPSENNYDKWHKETSQTMKSMETPFELTYGQIQKWINMTVKYLYTLRCLGVEKVDKYFADHKNAFHAPIDSYVLNAIGLNGIFWSKIATYEEYMNIRKQISFDDEYMKWTEFAENSQKNKDGMHRMADKGSYRRYIQENYSNKGITYCGKIRWKSKKDA